MITSESTGRTINGSQRLPSLPGGAKFEDLAVQHSICPSSRRGGEMGWIKQGMGLPPAFEGAIFDADIEELITTDSHKGLHIVQVLDEK